MINILKNIIVPVLLICSAQTSFGQTITFGETYPIVERDASDEIKERASGVDWQALYKKDPKTWRALQSPYLPDAEKDSVRLHKPIYIVEQDVVNKDGGIVYPKGYEYNPLDYVRMPNRIIVIGHNSQHLEWLSKQKQLSDMVITSGGDPISMSKMLGYPVFIATEKMVDRFKLRSIPTIVEQVGNELQLSEYRIHEKTLP